MIKLIYNEIIKILHKKSFYIVTILFILFSILVNYVYSENTIIMGEDVAVEELEKENSNLDLTKESNLDIYIDNLVAIETYNLKKIYKGSNKENLIDKYLEPIIKKIISDKYKSDSEDVDLLNIKEEYINHIKKDDWKYFVNKDIEKLNGLSYDNELANKRKEYYLKLKEYRLNNNVSYDDKNYLNIAIEDIEINLYEYLNLVNKSSLNKDETERYNYLKESMLKDEYILKEKKDINTMSNIRGVIISFPDEFGLFILIYIIMLSGSIVSEEFNKGTIKSLLVKPYKRHTILSSKLLSLLIILPLLILFMYLVELIIGFFFFGFSSLKIPMVIYNANKNMLVIENVFKYSFKSLLSITPMYLVLFTLCFMLSTITLSTSAAVAITFMFYFVSNIVKVFYLQYHIKILKGFVSLHWNFNYLVNYIKNDYNFKPLVSISIVSIYIFILLTISYIFFNKKDVKNI